MADQPLLVLGKITAILDAFTLSEPTHTASEIRAITGLPMSTTHRLVGNLVEHGFLDRTGDAYRIGARMAFWAGPAVRSLDFTEVLVPVLNGLRDETGETACFFRPEGQSRVCTGIAETRHALRLEMYVGRIQPLHVGSSGRVILAWRPDLLDAVLSEPLPALTDSTITEPDELQRAVADTRDRGYAITTRERMESASGLAAPVFDSHEALVGAMTLIGPSLRMSAATCEAMIEDVVAAADRLTAALGGRRPA